MNSPKPTVQFVKGDDFTQEECDLKTTGYIITCSAVSLCG